MENYSEDILTKRISETDLPSRVKNALERFNIFHVRQLLELRESFFVRINGIGKLGYVDILKFLDKHNLKRN